MVTGIVVREVDGSSNRMRERFRVQKALSKGSRTISRVPMRTSTHPDFAYGNSAGYSLLRSIERMHTEMLEFKAEAEQGTRSLREDTERETKALKDELMILRPLRETAVNIRRRFFATFRRDHDKLPTPGDTAIIQIGNHAAHKGDVITDVSLFRNHFMDCHSTFVEIYGLDWCEAYPLLGILLDCSTPPVFSAVRGPRRARWGDCQDPRTRRDGKM